MIFFCLQQKHCLFHRILDVLLQIVGGRSGNTRVDLYFSNLLHKKLLKLLLGLFRTMVDIFTCGCFSFVQALPRTDCIRLSPSRARSLQ